MLDIHLPHGKLQGFKEFFLHLFTITIGLFIALSLEGLVEYQHHRHLASEAEKGLRAEIALNAQQIVHIRQRIKQEQQQLEETQRLLTVMREYPEEMKGNIPTSFDVENFNDTAWKTAQNTGALAYMPYKDAQAFSDIYIAQDIYLSQGLRDIEDVSNASSLFSNRPEGWLPSPAQIDIEADRIGKLQYDVKILGGLAEYLDQTYKQFESEHK